MRPLVPLLALAIGYATGDAALAEGVNQTMTAALTNGVGSLSPSQLYDLGELDAEQTASTERSTQQRLDAITGNVFFGQLVWWWAVERNLTAASALETLLDAWQARYGTPAPAELEHALQNALSGIPPVRTATGGVYQPPSYVVTGPIYQMASPFSVGWPGLDPQILSGISRISTGFAN
jgi:hypothetical protein